MRQLWMKQKSQLLFKVTTIYQNMFVWRLGNMPQLIALNVPLNCRASFKNNGNSQNLKKIGRPNLLSEELLKRTKDVIVGSRLAGTVISRRMVIAIGTGVVKVNDPDTMVQIYFVSERQAPLLFLNTYMWLTVTLVIGTSVLFLDLPKFLQTCKSCFYNYTLLHIKRLYLKETEIKLDFCFDFFAFQAC